MQLFWIVCVSCEVSSELVKISPFLKKVPNSSVKIPVFLRTDSLLGDNCDLKSINLSSKMYQDSVIPAKPETFSGMAAKSPIAQCIEAVLRRACFEKRLTIGLLPAIQYLSKDCNGALFCFTAEAPPGDSATHMQEVLLQAFCEENEIFLIKVDSEAKMKRLLGCRKSTIDFRCVLVHYPYTDPFSEEIDVSSLSNEEKALIDHCDSTFYEDTPVFKLPEK